MPFITNSSDKDLTLSKRLNELIPESDEMKFLVGFFYFSGIRELYEGLKRLKEEGRLNKGALKILIGLDVDEMNAMIIEYGNIRKYFSYNEVKNGFLESLRKVFNSEVADTPEFYEQVNFFIELLENEIIEIRKTLEPNHSKIYLFKLNEKQLVRSLFIVGSSNLTKAGLESQNEFNVEIRDYGFSEAEKYFDKLWKKSIQFQKEDIEKIVKVLKEESLFKEVTPFEVWVYLLKMYLDLYSGKDSTHESKVREILNIAGYKSYNYQVEAILQAVKIIEHHNGVILADVVGLGKTVIACAIAKILGKRGLVITPPHLMGDENSNFGWKKYIQDFKLYDWEVRSLGKLEEVLEFVKKSDDIEIVIVDEAHRFRNESTKTYHLLHEICRGKKVILLTATPFNNKPSDIFALLKLFTVPKKSTIVLDGNLSDRFERYQKTFEKLAYIKNRYSPYSLEGKVKQYYKQVFGEDKLPSSRQELLKKLDEKAKYLAKSIRSIIEPVVIRRNRLDLKYYGEKIDMSEVKDPIECFFVLNKEQSKFYNEVIETFKEPSKGGKFMGAIYRPINYYKKGIEKIEEYIDIEEEGEGKEIAKIIKEITKEERFAYYSQRNLYNFMRRLLVKRFESSFGAFKSSLDKFIDFHEKAIKFVEKTKFFILDKRLIEKVVDADDDEEVDTIMNEYISNLSQIGSEINNSTGGSKTEKFFEMIKQKKLDPSEYEIYDFSDEAKRKEFLDAINKDKEVFEEIRRKYEEVGLSKNDPKLEVLIQEIKKFLKDRKVVIFTEYIDTAKYLENHLKKEFGSKVLVAYGNLSKTVVNSIYENFDAQYDGKKQKDDYTILLATDKLSEGFNLNRAGVVINYDIPWNPVRVIQRVGRINRIAKKIYDEIYILNFFPTEKGEDINRQREIAQSKMFMIHEVLGEDAKIFSPDEEPSPSELYRRLIEYREEDSESFLSKVRSEFEEIRNHYPNIVEKVSRMPLRVKVSKQGENDELFVFIRKGNDLFVGYKDYNESNARVVSFEEVYDKVKVSLPNVPRELLSSKFWDNYRVILEKKFEDDSRRSSNSLPVKARNMLKTILENIDNFEELKELKQFLISLFEDIELYETLTDYVLSEIVDWEGLYNEIKNEKSDKIKDLKDRITKLRDEIGENFVEKISRYFDNIKETIIVAIENQNIQK